MSVLTTLMDELDLARLLKRLVSEDCIGDAEFVSKVIVEYKKFFILVAESDGDNDIIVPSQLIDFVWQRHQLDTLNYFDDCKNFGIDYDYLHRHAVNSLTIHPILSVTGECLDVLDVKKCDNVLQYWYDNTKDLYETIFGMRPPENIWPAQFVSPGTEITQSISGPPCVFAAPWMDIQVPRILGIMFYPSLILL